jgi:hypothetical protein
VPTNCAKFNCANWKREQLCQVCQVCQVPMKVGTVRKCNVNKDLPSKCANCAKCANEVEEGKGDHELKLFPTLVAGR